MSRLSALIAVAGCALVVAACDEKETRATAPARPRPVLSVIAASDPGPRAAFTGTIEPRFTSTLAFRVVGRIVARDETVGDVVTRGDRLAALDPVPYDLAVRTAQAAVVDAEAQYVRVEAEEWRVRTLLAKSHASSQQYEAAQQALEAARAGVTQSRSALEKAREQRGYADLRAEFDGVVTAVTAEVNQVVTPGQPIMAIARPDQREAVIDLPDDVAGTLHEGSAFQVALQIEPSMHVEGRVREIAPRIDALTRSRRVKIALSDPPPAFRLGSMITARAAAPSTGEIRIPATAIFESEGVTAVWIVDPTSLTVARRVVEVGKRSEAGVEIVSGLVPGDRVVTAGVHSLEQGRAVRVPEKEPR